MSILRMAGARVLSVGGSTAFKVPTMTKSTAAAITDEEGNYDEAEPTFNEVTFTPWKYTADQGVRGACARQPDRPDEPGHGAGRCAGVRCG